jgi:hypothetical protein
MKKQNKFHQTIAVLLFSILAFACLDDTTFSSPTIDCTAPEIVATNMIQQIKQLYQYGSAAPIDDDLIIEGIVISTDEFGNTYKSLTLQDSWEDPTAGIKLAIDKTHLYTKYEIGRKVYVKLKGLAIGFMYGSLYIGKIKNGELDRIPGFDLNDHLVRSCDVTDVIPKKISIENLAIENTDMLIQLDGVQFNEMDLNKTYGSLANTSTNSIRMELFNKECKYLKTLDLNISGFASFKHEQLAVGNGSISGIINRYYDDLFLEIRNTKDIILENNRCDYGQAFEITTTLVDVKEMYKGELVEFGTDPGKLLEGFVISDNRQGNFMNLIVLQDSPDNPGAGIQILIETDSDEVQFIPGEKVFIKLDKLYMDEVQGILSMGVPGKKGLEPIPKNLLGSIIFNSHEHTEIEPVEINLSDITESSYENTLISISGLQLESSELGKPFTFFSGDLDGVRTLEKCGDFKKLQIQTNGSAEFANELFPQGNGKVTGIITTYLKVRTKNDVDFNLPREDCPIVKPKVFITELADPVNSVGARFVEIFNADDKSIDLSGWTLNKYNNGSTTVTGQGIDLTGIVIKPSEYLIIANLEYKHIFNDIPDIETNYITGNGDDVYALNSSTGTIVDVFGVIGEDGNGKRWEYLDGKAIRKPTIVQSNEFFDPEEWLIYSLAKNDKVDYPFTAQRAPENFNPRAR